MGDVTGKAVRSVGYAEPWILDTTAGIPPLQITRQDDGSVRLTFPSDVPAETLEIVRQRMETRTDTEADLVTQLNVDYDANEAAMPFQNAQIQALTEQMQRVIRLVTGRPEGG